MMEGTLPTYDRVLLPLAGFHRLVLLRVMMTKTFKLWLPPNLCSWDLINFRSFCIVRFLEVIKVINTIDLNSNVYFIDIRAFDIESWEVLINGLHPII